MLHLYLYLYSYSLESQTNRGFCGLEGKARDSPLSLYVYRSYVLYECVLIRYTSTIQVYTHTHIYIYIYIEREREREKEREREVLHEMRVLLKSKGKGSERKANVDEFFKGGDLGFYCKTSKQPMPGDATALSIPGSPPRPPERQGPPEGQGPPLGWPRRMLRLSSGCCCFHHQQQKEQQQQVEEAYIHIHVARETDLRERREIQEGIKH